MLKGGGAGGAGGRGVAGGCGVGAGCAPVPIWHPRIINDRSRIRHAAVPRIAGLQESRRGRFHGHRHSREELARPKAFCWATTVKVLLKLVE